MPTSKHDDDEHEFAEGVPRAAEGVGVVGDAGAQAYGAEGGDGVEEDGVEVEAGRGDREAGAFDDGDDEVADEEPPGVGGELRFEVGLFTISVSLDIMVSGTYSDVRTLGTIAVLVFLRFLYAYRSLLIYVGRSDRDDDG